MKISLGCCAGEEGHTWWRRKMETLQSLPGFYPRGRREGQSLISRVCHILPVKETPPCRLDGAVHSTDGLLYGRADEGVALPADGGHCRDTQVEHQQARAELGLGLHLKQNQSF